MLEQDQEVRIMTKVEKWATAKKLSEKTADTLIQLGFDSMEALSLLTGDDLQDTYIPRGQWKLLIHAVKATFPEGAVANKNPWSNRDNFAKNAQIRNFSPIVRIYHYQVCTHGKICKSI